MTTLRGLIFVCSGAGLAATMAASGCSSSSSPATPGTDGGGPEASVVVTVDAGADGPMGASIVTLQWAVGEVAHLPSGPGDGGVAEAGVSEAGVVPEAGAAEAGLGDAGVDAGEADAAAPDAGEIDDAGAGEKVDGASLANLPPLAGVQVCVYQNSSFPCVTTQADGTFTLPGLPVRTQLTLALTKSGYLSYLLPIATASTDTDERNNPVIMSPSGQTPAVPVAVDGQNKGSISAFAVNIGGTNQNVFAMVPGVTQVTLSPASGNGPYFVNDMTNEYDYSATSFVGTQAVYFNVDPGTYTLTYANSTNDCEPVSFPFAGFGWPLTTPAHSIKIVVAAGYVTGIVGFLCTPNAVIVSVDGG